MEKVITFNELRRIKDSLPHGSVQKIAEELNLEEDTVRNYFGGADYVHGKSVGFHAEQGPDGGVITLDDITILEKAKKILSDLNIAH